MFTSPIVVVVGAGASVEYNMPLGYKLAADIAEDVRFRFEHYSHMPSKGDQDLFNLLFRQYQKDKPKLDRFTRGGNELAAAISSAVSVDDALFQLSENEEAITLGKLCIIRSILKAEQKSALALSSRTGRLDENAGRDGWVEQLFSMAITGLKKSEIQSAFDNITFVNFNYDRCIEQYLYFALQRIGIEEAGAALIVAGLNMIRPYGSVGPLLPSIPNHVLFGGAVDPFNMLAGIRTYTENESLHDSGHLVTALQGAKLVLFLGFGFHAQNLRLLQLPDPRAKRVMATVKKVHQANRIDIQSALGSTLRVDPDRDVELYDMTAPEMLGDLRLKIMMRAGA
ncbi:hypothetical protein JQ609_09060 [Bradyrhizobium sp. AUGA SZCCT0169]|uniref:hypothetical protein n=1 Tax=Bradyrhizobium sp. AUGA SZCCT0169 TaxID=2807663 RepID=UPI001BA7EA4B|nr:hypothetical protein [Bradyrhizobium sp. AUGA SZCCT0169]MBR1247080.1 hypothetical protein [Bradyrhizobium sp. AUGA SZCCT0169]